jgi:large subunit ribosomal protein L9
MSLLSPLVDSAALLRYPGAHSLDNSPLLVYHTLAAVRQLGLFTRAEIPGKRGRCVKVILVADVPNLGRTGDVKEVADGYGRNYLIPKGLAKVATTGEVQQARQLRRSAQSRHQRELEDAEELAEHLSGMSLTFQARAGEGTKLYGSITSADIAEKLSEKLGREFDRRKIRLEESLRQLGTHQVIIHLAPQLEPEITVVIERKGEGEEGE